MGTLTGASVQAAGNPAAPTMTYTFPAQDVVYPAGVAHHAGNGDFFAGSTTGGAVYRGNTWRDSRALEPFLPAVAAGAPMCPV